MNPTPDPNFDVPISGAIEKRSCHFRRRSLRFAVDPHHCKSRDCLTRCVEFAVYPDRRFVFIRTFRYISAG